MADLTKTTTLVNGDVLDPQVISDMVRAKVEKRAVMSGYTKVDTTLQGQPGSTITVPRWGYIGEATDKAEGDPIDPTKMGFTSEDYGIKKIGKAVELTDEAVLSGYGNPMATASNQLAMSIADKLDNDRVGVLYDSSNSFDNSTANISYTAIVDGVDVFNEEEDSAKVILIHSRQKTQLRKDPNFLSGDKFAPGVMMTGSIGMIAGCQVIVSNKVRAVEYTKDNSAGTITIVADGVNETATNKHLSTIQPSTMEKLVVGDKVKAVSQKFYANPIVKLTNSAETEDDIPAVTYFLKRDSLVEPSRIPGVSTRITVTAHGMPALTNEAKVVILKTKA